MLNCSNLQRGREKRSMNLGEQNIPTSPRPAVLSSVSSRTLPRPSLMPLCLAAAGVGRYAATWDVQPVPSMTPNDLYYIDPNNWIRIPNLMTGCEVFNSFQLNIPPPIMSTHLAPPHHPDPFRSHHSYPIVHLGCPRQVASNGTVQTPLQQLTRTIIELSQEEDDTITNLLKLGHAEEPSSSGDKLQGGRSWSDVELEAADTLLTRFSVTERNAIQTQHLENLSPTPPDPLSHQDNTDWKMSSKIQRGSKSSFSNTSRFTGVKEPGEPGFGVDLQEHMLSDSESAAVCGLLSLRDVEVLKFLK